MATNRSRKHERTADHERGVGATEIRERTLRSEPTGEAAAQRAPAAPVDSDETRAERARQQAAIEQQRALAERNVRLARSPGAMGPFGRNLLLIGVLVLAALIGVWALLVV